MRFVRILSQQFCTYGHDVGRTCGTLDFDLHPFSRWICVGGEIRTYSENSATIESGMISRGLPSGVRPMSGISGCLRTIVPRLFSWNESTLPPLSRPMAVVLQSLRNRFLASVTTMMGESLNPPIPLGLPLPRRRRSIRFFTTHRVQLFTLGR